MRLTCLVGALVLAGCGPASSEECAKGPPSLELGVGTDAYQSLEEAGGEATLVYGAQGGYHLELALAASGIRTDDLATAVLTGTIDGQELASNSDWLQLRCDPSTGRAEAWNVRLIYNAEPEELGGKQTEVTALVIDADGTEVEAVGTVEIVDPLQ